MSKGSAIFILFILLAGGGYYYYDTRICSSFLSKKKMEVGGKEYETWPKDARENAGLELRRVANGKNAAVFYVKASNAFEERGGASEDRWVEQNAQCLKLLHRAAKRSKCEFPIFGSDHDCAYAQALPIMPAIRGFSRLLVFEGRRQWERGAYNEAMECYFALTATSSHVRQSNAVFVVHLVAVALEGMRDAAVEECLASGKLDKQELRKTIEHYSRAVREGPRFVDAMQDEKNMLDNTVKEMVRRPEIAGKLAGWMAPGAADRDYSSLVQVIREHGAQLQQEYNRSSDALLRWSRMPSWEALRPENDFTNYLDGLPDTCLLSKMFLPATAKARESFARGQAQTQGVLIFAAIKLYEKKNGRPPRALSELKGDYLSELPKDPFSGRDYIYKVRGNDWILYSVWENLRDDGGAGSWPHKRKRDRDFIWRNTRLPVD